MLSGRNKKHIKFFGKWAREKTLFLKRFSPEKTASFLKHFLPHIFSAFGKN